MALGPRLNQNCQNCARCPPNAARHGGSYRGARPAQREPLPSSCAWSAGTCPGDALRVLACPCGAERPDLRAARVRRPVRALTLSAVGQLRARALPVRSHLASPDRARRARCSIGPPSATSHPARNRAASTLGRAPTLCPLPRVRARMLNPVSPGLVVASPRAISASATQGQQAHGRN